MFRRWAFWRRVQYGSAFLILCTLIAIPVYLRFFVVEPTCFDGLHNGVERGIDCGGACQKICVADIAMPVVLWTQSFEVMPGQYNAVAYLENRNIDIGAPELPYTFKLYDADGLITEKSGVTVFPPDGTYPIFEGRIRTGDRIPTRTEIVIASDTLWRHGTVGRDQFTLARRELIGVDSQPRLIAEITNNSLDVARDVEIVAVIFSAGGTPLTASRTVLAEFLARDTESVELTWPRPIAKTLRSCEVPTDVLLGIDLSGSMNDDGGVPPEPVTSVLAAAQSFVERLGARDQVGVVTYATEADMRQVLTRESDAVADLVGALTIDPESERGSTNTGDALLRMTEEFRSERHSDDARKVAILLTDGLATAPGEDPEGYALSRVAELKAQDVTVFAIGLGANVNRTFLASLASSPNEVFVAPSAKEVDGIYQTITSAICEDGPSVIEVIAKPETSFR